MVFKDSALTDRFSSQKYFDHKVGQLSEVPDEFKKARVSRASPSSDIIWKNLGNSEASALAKVTLYFIFILLLSLLFLTPSVVLDLVDRVSDTVSFLVAYFNPFAVLFVNFTLIPILIALFVESSGFRQRSKELVSITW